MVELYVLAVFIALIDLGNFDCILTVRFDRSFSEIDAS